MRCPSCTKEFHPQPDKIKDYMADEREISGLTISFMTQRCPSCNEIIVIRSLGIGVKINTGVHVQESREEYIIFPMEKEFSIEPEVPEEYAKDYLEAYAAVQYSPKASAALSRRLLQKILREVLGIKRKDLSQEIDFFINTGNAPSYLTQAVDAVRQIGNFAAHPMKNTNTGEIAEVEVGEAEWLLEVIDSLFDFTFVQPAHLELRRTALNEKLKELGKPELKS